MKSTSADTWFASDFVTECAAENYPGWDAVGLLSEEVQMAVNVDAHRRRQLTQEQKEAPFGISPK